MHNPGERLAPARKRVLRGVEAIRPAKRRQRDRWAVRFSPETQKREADAVFRAEGITAVSNARDDGLSGVQEHGTSSLGPPRNLGDLHVSSRKKSEGEPRNKPQAIASTRVRE